MAEKCPYCYRPLGTHSHDPILLPNGAPNDWISDTELVYEPDVANRWYKGVYQVSETDIIELQDELRLEEVNKLQSIYRTEFSPVNSSGKFQITGKHIKEMRDSVEKLIDAYGMTKIEYFNYDEEGNHIIIPGGDKTNWTDPITSAIDLQKFQIKYIHIEELRHYMRILGWIERFNITPAATYIDIPYNYTSYISESTGTIYSWILGDKNYWYVSGLESFTSFYPSDPDGGWLYPNGYIDVVNRIITISDGSVSSKKLSLGIDSSGSVTNWKTSGGIIYSPSRRVIITDIITSPKIYWHITDESGLTNNTHLSMTSLSNIIYTGVESYLESAYIHIRVYFFYSGHYIDYYTGIMNYQIPHVFPADSIVLPNFNNFNRNICNDYITKYGSLPPVGFGAEEVDYIDMDIKLAYYANGYYNPAPAGLITFVIDNISVFNSTS